MNKATIRAKLQLRIQVNLELFDKEKSLLKKFLSELKRKEEILIYAVFYIHCLIFDISAIYVPQKYSALDKAYVELYKPHQLHILLRTIAK